jgi:hypothetical protein
MATVDHFFALSNPALVSAFPKKQLTHRLASPWIETLVLRKLSFAWTVTASILEALTPSKNLVQGKAADPTVAAPFGDPV